LVCERVVDRPQAACPASRRRSSDDRNVLAVDRITLLTGSRDALAIDVSSLALWFASSIAVHRRSRSQHARAGRVEPGAKIRIASHIGDANVAREFDRIWITLRVGISLQLTIRNGPIQMSWAVIDWCAVVFR